jgi:environmental stress-induced protein Ves
MQINLTKKEQLQTNTWQGGTTTQLAIYPEGAEYKNLDFIFRISTATIDVEQSTFTVLPNVSRGIMVLDGGLIIQHENHYTRTLNKFDTDSFSGDWETTSMGKATDFNVMTRGNAKAGIKGFSLPQKVNKELTLDCDVMAVYIYSGEVIIQEATQKITLSRGDIAIISKENKKEAFRLQSTRNSDIAIAQIHLSVSSD